MSAPDNVRDIESARPYHSTAKAYFRRGWFPLPVRAGQKQGGMPIGFSGNDNPYPTMDDIKRWLNHPGHHAECPSGCKDPKVGRTANVVVRMPVIDDTFDVIGIDVDHYGDKTGADALEELEAQYGDLPATWRSTNRGLDNPSGIRFYLAPKDLDWPGTVRSYIDILRPGYRYAMVAPSWHPEGRQYTWVNPDGKPLSGTVNIPNPRHFPMLPSPWVDFLTGGQTREERPIDRDSKVNEIEQWALDSFAESQTPCAFTEKRTAAWKETIDSDFAKHDKIKEFHWEFLNIGPEGHTGWLKAVVELENYWIDSIKRDRPDRNDLRTIADEMFRSRMGALRKIKGKIELLSKQGIDGLTTQCGCQKELSSWAADDFTDKNGKLTIKKRFINSAPRGKAKAVSEYDATDDGNGEHFRDLFTTSAGAVVRFVHDQGRYGAWITWDNSSATWQPDPDGAAIRECWREVKKRQKDFVKKLEKDLDDHIAVAVNGGQPTSGMNASPELLKARARYTKWLAHLEKSGMNRHAEEAIKNAGRRVGISCSKSDLDANKNLLAVANGVLELGPTDVVLREGRMSDLITMNTGVPWRGPDSNGTWSSGVGLNPQGVTLWNEFLDRFLPDPKVREIAQIAMGSTLLGGNPERIMLIFIGESSTGKSTFSRVCASALGDYGAPIGKEAFQGYKFKPALTLNANRRFVTNSEFDSRTQMSTAVIKEMTGGGDLIPTESKGVDEVVISDLHFTPGIATNKMPQLIDADTAVERRLYPIHFDQVMPEGSAKGDFVDLMESCALDSVLAWMVEGYRRYRALGGLVRNALTEAWRKEIMAEVDEISLFIGECLTVAENYRDPRVRWQDAPEKSVLTSDLYARYQLWYTVNNYPAYQILSQHKFSSRMKDLGYLQDLRRFNKKMERRWLGVAIRSSSGGARVKMQRRSVRSGSSSGLKSVD